MVPSVLLQFLLAQTIDVPVSEEGRKTTTKTQSQLPDSQGVETRRQKANFSWITWNENSVNKNKEWKMWLPSPYGLLFCTCAWRWMIRQKIEPQDGFTLSWNAKAGAVWERLHHILPCWALLLSLQAGVSHYATSMKHGQALPGTSSLCHLGLRYSSQLCTIAISVL